MTSPDEIESAAVVRTRTAGGLSGVTFHPTPRARLSLPYNTLKSAELREGGEVILTFQDYLVTLRGARLEQLPEDFILHKVLRVQQSARRQEVGEAAAGELIERIVVLAIANKRPARRTDSELEQEG